MSALTIWTKREFQYEINRTYDDLKQYGWTKKQCKQEVEKTMRDNGIVLEKKLKKN